MIFLYLCCELNVCMSLHHSVLTIKLMFTKRMFLLNITCCYIGESVLKFFPCTRRLCTYSIYVHTWLFTSVIMYIHTYIPNVQRNIMMMMHLCVWCFDFRTRMGLLERNHRNTCLYVVLYLYVVHICTSCD